MYIALHLYLVYRFNELKKSPKDILHLTTKIGSTLHSFLMMFFFHPTNY